MKFINDIIWIEGQEAIDSGIPKGTMDAAKWRGSSEWEFMDDPSDARKILIRFDSLSPANKAKIITKFGEPKKYLANSILLSHLLPDPNAVKFFHEYRYDGDTTLPQRHIEKYRTAAQWLNLLLDAKAVCKKLKWSKKQFKDAVRFIIKDKEIDLPANYSNLQRRMNEYREKGYEVLVSKNFGNDNSEKLCEDAKHWLLNEYSSPLKLHHDIPTLRLKYKMRAKALGWKEVTEQCIYQYLNRPEVERYWYLARHGWSKWRMRYEYQMLTIPPSFRDALWEGDGTKLNFFTDGLRAELWMYFIVDVHSEVILGYDFSKEREDFEVQRRTLKRALQKSGHKPYQIKYDHQGGHLGAQAKTIFDALTEVHFPAKKKSPNSKKIESIIGRFQKQTMSKYWFFTGMNVTAKSVNSSPNMEYYMDHMKELPSLDVIIREAENCVAEWNNMKHPHFSHSRLEQYNTSENKEPRPVTEWDMINMFYNTTDEMIYYPGGIKPVINGRKMRYEVVDENGNPNLNLIQDKFVVKYDPEDYEDQVLLYKRINKELHFIAIAKNKEAVPTAVADYKEGDAERIKRGMRIKKEQREMYEGVLADVADEVKRFDAEDAERATGLLPKNNSIYLSDDDDEIKIVND